MQDLINFANAYDIPGFCQAHHISRAFLYKLWKEGRGPRIIKIGRRTLISREAAAEWLRSLEASA